jgi:membrane-bound lytic murein transglycosylase D
MRHRPLVVLIWLAAVAVPVPCSAGSGTADPAVLDRGEETPLAGASAEELERLTAEIRGLRERLELLEENLAATRRGRPVYPLPDPVEFAGEAVPLGRWDVRERLEREFFRALGDWAQVILWLKRSARYFPFVEDALAKAGLPDDLKYVAVVESALLPTAYSSASALGIWQFIAATGRRYGLAISPWWDERRNPEASTRAALAYLKDLHARFGTWPLALAGYNAGEARVAQTLQSQRVATYYQLALPEETERYVLRVLAAKLILSDAARYGFEVPTEQRYRLVEADTVEIEVRDRVSVTDLGQTAGSFYREIKALNPEIMQEWLPKGRYPIRVPPGHAGQFVTQLAGLAHRVTTTTESGRDSVRYQVKRGDTLLGIAQRFGVPDDRAGNAQPLRRAVPPRPRNDTPHPTTRQSVAANALGAQDHGARNVGGMRSSVVQTAISSAGAETR